MNEYKTGDIIHYNRNSFSCRGFLTVMIMKSWYRGGAYGYTVYTLLDEAGYLKKGDVHFLSASRVKFYELRSSQ